MMKKLILSVIIVQFVLLFNCGPESARNGQFVRVQGKEIVTPDGEPLLLRGIGLGNWLVPEGYMFKFRGASSPRLINNVISELIGPAEARNFWERFRDNYIRRDDIMFLKEIGLNSVRVPFNYRLFTLEQHPDVWLDTGFDMLDRVIGWCREAGIWVILDMHCAPGGQTGDNIDDSWGWPWLFESPESQQRTADVWRKIAERYADETFVLGYDLLNEPIPHWEEVQKYNDRLEPLYKKIVSAIRQVDDNHIIFIGGRRWNNRFDVFGPPFDDKLVYTFHKYWTVVNDSSIQEYIDFREKYDVPVWLGESGENSNAWIDSLTTLLEKNNIGWCYWPYKKMDSDRCIVGFPRPADYDVIIDYARLFGENFAGKRKALPDPVKTRQILDEFLENSKFENCSVNEGYVKALHPLP